MNRMSNLKIRIQTRPLVHGHSVLSRFICIGMEDSVNSSMEFSSTTCRDTYIDLDTN